MGKVIRRYRRVTPLPNLTDMLPTRALVAVTPLTRDEVNITIDDAVLNAAADLDDVMGYAGFAFVVQDPAGGLPASVRANTLLTVPVASTTLLTLPAIDLMGPVLLRAAVEAENSNVLPRFLTLQLFRDGVEVDTTDRFRQRLGVSEREVLGVQFYDSGGGLNTVYSLRAFSDTTTDVTVENRILTADY
jgi:hypothetical protein